MTTRSKFLWGLAAGAAIGTAAGVLLAPKTGIESRKAVTTGAGRTWTALKHKVNRGNGHAHQAEEQHSETLR